MAKENTETPHIQGTGGHNSCFVESPPNDLVCKIWLNVSFDAQQTNSCCGSNFYRDWNAWKDMYNPPLLMEKCFLIAVKSFAFVPDLRAERQILNSTFRFIVPTSIWGVRGLVNCDQWKITSAMQFCKCY